MDGAWTFARRQDQVGTMPRLFEHSSHGRHACCKDQAKGRHASDGLRKRTSMCSHDSNTPFEASRESDRCILLTNVSLHHRIDVWRCHAPILSQFSRCFSECRRFFSWDPSECLAFECQHASNAIGTFRCIQSKRKATFLFHLWKRVVPQA